MDGCMKLRSNLIVGVLYDIETDEHVFLHADGHRTSQPHDPWVNSLAAEYSLLLSRLNGGLYVRAYAEAAEKFASTGGRH